jgi:hypothetical protein
VQLTGLAASWGNINGTLANQADLAAAIAAKAALSSPTFTGTPAAPTPATADDSTRLATTAMVQAVLAAKKPYLAACVIDTATASYSYKDDPISIFGSITRNSAGDCDVAVTGMTENAIYSINTSRDQLACESEVNNLYFRTRSSSGGGVDSKVVITIFKL